MCVDQNLLACSVEEYKSQNYLAGFNWKKGFLPPFETAGSSDSTPSPTPLPPRKPP